MPTTQPPEAFKRWFGKSVIAIDGNPLIVYHGGADIPRTRNRAFRTYGEGKWGEGAYFTPERWKAKDYADMRKGGVVGEYFLRIERPVILYESQAYSEATDKLVREVRDTNDGLIIVQAEYGSPVRFDRNVTEIIVFDARQIKSVENSGIFSTVSADVLNGFRRSR